MATRPEGQQVTAWRPAVPGITEVFHARFTDHAYPPHTHDVWTLLIVDDGAIRYDLDRRHHGAVRPSVTLLPPHVPHDGRAATRDGFHKRVLYLDTSVLGAELTGAAVDAPSLPGALLRQRVDQLHRALADPGDAFEAESRLAFVSEHLRALLRHRDPDGSRPGGGAVRTGVPARDVATNLRDLLDARTADGVGLREAAELLHAHPTHLVRAFTDRYGLPPHRYLTGRRIERARQLLLAGRRPAEAAVAAGFYDQSHLTRHFTRYLGISPARYAASHRTR